MSQAGKLHTAYKVKDTYQDSFIDRIATLTCKLTGSMASKQKKVDNLVATFPIDTLSLVWHIKGTLLFSCLILVNCLTDDLEIQVWTHT